MKYTVLVFIYVLSFDQPRLDDVESCPPNLELSELDLDSVASESLLTFLTSIPVSCDQSKLESNYFDINLVNPFV